MWGFVEVDGWVIKTYNPCWFPIFSYESFLILYFFKSIATIVS